MKKIIYIKDSLDSLEELFIIQKSTPNGISIIELNFLQCPFIAPYMLLCLAQLIIGIRNINPTIKFTIDWANQISVKKYVESLEFRKFIIDNVKQPKEITPIRRNTALPFFRISKDYIFSYKTEALKFCNNINYSKDWSGFLLTIEELLNNVYDHAESPTGAYTFMQYWPNARSNQLKVVIGDLGIGLSTKIRQSKEEYEKKTTIEVIKLAFTEHFSTRSKPNNQGKGLSNVKNLIISCKGIIKVYTAEGAFELNGISKKIKPITPQNKTNSFLGTLIYLEISPFALPEIENEEEMEL